MDKLGRRDFLKLVGAGGVGAGAGFLVKESSKHPYEQYVPYVLTPEDYTPGIATWYNTVCGQCQAGCGIQVRVREGRAKKIEGNPRHPVSQGHSCPLGQSALQVLYNPDRVRQPVQRSGERGSGSTNAIDWDQAFVTVADRLGNLRRNGRANRVCLLTGHVGGHVGELIGTFAEALGTERYLQYEFAAPETLAHANRLFYGDGTAMPYYDLGNADLVLSFGADFLSTWLSPVHHNLAYGHLRQGARRERGRIVQIEPRMSLTGANADVWLPARPGTEGLIALAIASRLVESSRAADLDKSGWRRRLEPFTAERAARASGVDAARIEALADEFGAVRRPLAIGGGAAAGASNGVANMLAVNLLNTIAGNTGRPGGVLFNPPAAIGAGLAERRTGFAGLRRLIADIEADEIDMLVVYGTNPLHTTPAAAGLREALAKVPSVIALTDIIDDTAAMADLVLPTHSPLESWWDATPEPGMGLATASLAQPVVAPVFDTRAPGDILLELGQRVGGDMAAALPWQDTRAYLRDRWRELYDARSDQLGDVDFDTFWDRVLSAGVWAEERRATPPRGGSTQFIDPGAAEYAGDAADYPLHLHPFLSHAFHDGRGASLPWLQELPDPLTGVVYASWAELNPRTAEAMGLETGDVVEITSPAGSLRAPVLVFPAVRPDVVAMPVGQGHEHYGRYASGRGANPLSILAPDVATRDGALATAATRVKIAATGDRMKLIRQSGETRTLGRAILGPDGEGGAGSGHGAEHGDTGHG